MNKLMRKIIAALGLHNPGEPYKVKASDIIIPEEFKATKPRFKKMIQKREFYRKNDRFESKIHIIHYCQRKRYEICRSLFC